jgi:hypothetical protein
MRRNQGAWIRRKSLSQELPILGRHRYLPQCKFLDLILTIIIGFETRL